MFTYTLIGFVLGAVVAWVGLRRHYDRRNATSSDTTVRPMDGGGPGTTPPPPGDKQ